MPKYTPSDDGRIVDGRMVIYFYSAQAAPPRDGAPPIGRARLAGLQAAALIAAAAKGVPFCAECEQARKELAKDGGSPR